MLEFTLWILDSRYWIPHSMSVSFRFHIPIFSGIPDSLNWITDSKGRDSGIPQVGHFDITAVSRFLWEKGGRKSHGRFIFFSSSRLALRLAWHPRLYRLHSRNYKGIGYKLSMQRFLVSFGWTSVTYDWLMVALNTIDQSQLTLVHPKDPRNHCAESLYPFLL